MAAASKNRQTPPPMNTKTREKAIFDFLPAVLVIVFALAKLYQANAFIEVHWDWFGPVSMSPTLQFEQYATSFGILLVIVGFLFIFQRKVRYVLLTIFSLLISLIIMADTYYASHYGTIPSIKLVPSIDHIIMVRDSIVDLFKPIYLIYFLDGVVLLLMFPIYARLCASTEATTMRANAATAALLMALGLAAATPSGLRVAQAGIIGDPLRMREYGATVGLFGYHVIDILFDQETQVDATDAQRNTVFRYFIDQRQKYLEESRMLGSAAGANVILISAESLMGFVVGLEVNGQKVTPTLSRFAKESLNFVNFHNQSWLSTTTDTEFAIMNSLHPLPFRSVAQTVWGNRFMSFPHMLSARGYTTLSAAGHPAWVANAEQTHPNYGFQHSLFESNFKATERIYGWVTDREFFQQMTPKIGQLRPPFLVYMMSSSTHHPYWIPDKYKTLDLGALEGSLFGNYLHAVHLFDLALGEFLADLRRTGVLDSTMIVLYGDHEANLGQDSDAMWRLLGIGPERRGFRWWTRQRLPLMIRLPGAGLSEIRETYGGHLDVAPTVLGLLGIEPRASVMLGYDLNRAPARSVVFRDGSFVNPTVHFVNRAGRIQSSLCFDPANSKEIDCAPFATMQWDARHQLEISDLIVRGDLVPDMLIRFQNEAKTRPN